MRAAGVRRYCPAHQAGAFMIEVLVTVVVVGAGIFGLIKLQQTMQNAELEAYQRTQALMLLNDIAVRMETNAAQAEAYLTTAPLGSGMRCIDAEDGSLHARDRAQWCRALQGAGERIGSSSVGALISGRGCIRPFESGEPGSYLLTVVWQGAVPMSAPPDVIDCGEGDYDQPPGSGCSRAPDRCRRYVSTQLRLADTSS